MKEQETDLTYTARVRVRFSEVDALNGVWHGNYVQYLEDAREAWGREYGLGYMDIFHNGFFAPVYELQLHYRAMATVNDELLVKITYCKTLGAKLIFHYEIRRAADNQLILTAESTQLFITQKGEFYPALPPFYEEWLKQHAAI